MESTDGRDGASERDEGSSAMLRMRAHVDQPRALRRRGVTNATDTINGGPCKRFFIISAVPVASPPLAVLCRVYAARSASICRRMAGTVSPP
jgi:hypothetical protein